MKPSFLLIFGFLIAPSAFGMQNEPDGFRGITWGSAISENASELKLVSKEGRLKVFIKKNDKMKIGDSKISLITYDYWNDKFLLATIMTEGSHNKKLLLDALYVKYGRPNSANEDKKTFLWLGSEMTIFMFCNLKTDTCFTDFRSLAGDQEKKADEASDAHSAAVKANNDF